MKTILYPYCNKADKTKSLYSSIIVSFLLLIASFNYGFTQQPTSTTNYFKQKIDSLKSLNKIENDTLYPFYLNELAYQIAFVNLDSMRIISLEADSISKKINYPNGSLQAKNNLADYYMILGEFDKAINVHKEIVNTSITNKNYLIILRSLNSLAYIQDQQFNLLGSFETITKGVDIAEKFNEKQFLVSLKMNLGILYAKIEDYDSSIETFENILNPNGPENTFYKAQVLSNLGNTLFVSKNYEKALKVLLEAESIFEKQDHIEWNAFTSILISRIYIEQQDLDKAWTYIEKAKIPLQSIGDPQLLVDYKLAKSAYFLVTKELDSAVSLAEQAKLLSKEINFTNGIVQSHELLSATESENNNYKKALELNLATQLLKDSVKNSNSKLRLKILTSFYETNKIKTQQIADLEQKEIQSKGILLISFITVAGLIAILYIYYRANRRQKILNAELVTSNDAKRKLLSIIGHDIKSPLNSLLELLTLYDLNEISEAEFLDHLPTLKEKVEHSTFTLNNLLYWAKTQMKGITAVPEFLNIHQKIEKSITISLQNWRLKT